MNAPIVNTMLRALLRWWWLIALAISLGVGVGYIFRTEQADLYTATATVSINEDSPNLLKSSNGSDALDKYLAMILSPGMLQPVIDDLGLNISVDDLLTRVTLSPDSIALLMGIKVVDTNPDRAATIANGIANEVLNQTSDRSSLLDREFITKQINDVQRQITEQQTKYDQLVQDAEGLTSAYDLSRNLEERNQIEAAIQGLRNLLLDLVRNVPKSEVTIFENATPNYYPISTNGTEDLIIAGVAGGALAFLTIILFTFFDDRLQWDEAKQDSMILGLRILGPLGIVPRQKLPLYVDTMPQSVEAEAMRQLRAKIALVAGGKYPRVVTVMSYDSGEGKTLTSANLALEVARGGLRTLIIDGDMRRSDLHELFQLPNIFGLSDVLYSREPLRNLLSEAILESGYDNLTILPAGRAAADPAALLGKSRFGELMTLLRSHYDAIVIDSAPTIGGPDAIFLSEHSDGTVIVVNAHKTRLSSLRRSVQELQSEMTSNIYGVVFNRVRLQVTSKYSNSYYYRHSPSLTSERLGREMTKSGAGLFALRRHIITSSNGERMFSVAASATRLGVRQRTVQSWIDSGYVHGERHFLRTWVSEKTITALMQQRTVAADPISEPAMDSDPEPATANGNHGVPAQLREQREAILGFANHSNQVDPES